MSHVDSHKPSRPRTPIFRAVRRIFDAVEDVIDDAVERGQEVERDARQLVQNLVRERDDEKSDKGDKGDKGDKVEKKG